MTEKRPIDIDFERVLETLSKQIYDTPMAFLRENMQNAIDALRMDKVDTPGAESKVAIEVEGRVVRITDTGIGMSADDLGNFYWRMGASGKNSEIARRAGCIGTFGIGGFANFGVCEELVVISKKRGHPGTRTSLNKSELGGTGTPCVSYEDCEDAAPHGTIVQAVLTEAPNTGQLVAYLRPFIAFAPEEVRFDGELLSQKEFIPKVVAQDAVQLTENQESLRVDANLELVLTYYKDKNDSIYVVIDRATLRGEPTVCRGILHLQAGAIEVYKRGFKLCNAPVSSSVGISGRLDVDAARPTAGRDSLAAESQQFVNRLIASVERRAIEWILTSSDLLAKHTRVFRYIRQQGFVNNLVKLRVSMADGNDEELGELAEFVQRGGVVYFGSRLEKDLLDILQASGHKIVILSGDTDRRRAEMSFLQSNCNAQSFESLVEIKEQYDDLSTFEAAFLGHLEAAMSARYAVSDVEIIPASITGGVPAFVQSSHGKRLRIFIDVRHAEIQKLESLGASPLLYSMASEFCKEYLSGTLKANSPKFFGSGALNFDELLKRSAEVWNLVADDVYVETLEREQPTQARRASSYGGVGIPQVVRPQDIREVSVGDAEGGNGDDGGENRKARILRVVDASGKLGVAGCYFRLMDGPVRAFGNDIQAMDEASLFWFGNRLTYVFSDGHQTAFHYEIRLQELIRVDANDSSGIGGNVGLDRPIQELGHGMFVPIPQAFEPFLIPTGDREIVVRVNYEWFDLRGGRVWPTK